MKKILFGLISALFLLLIASIVAGHNNSAPSLECAICHPGDLKPEIVSVEGIPNKFKTGKTYKIILSIKSDLQGTSEVSGGFAAEASAGELIVIDKKNTQAINGILTHTLKGSSLRKWTIGWKAPSQKVDATLVVMVVAANGDYSSMGDIVGAGSYVIKAGQ